MTPSPIRDSAEVRRKKVVRRADPVKARTLQMHATLKRRAAGAEVMSLAELRVNFNHFMRQGGFCPYCRARVSHVNVSLDHKIPANRGGGHTTSNLVFCCRGCNKAKGNRTADEFTDLIGALNEIGVRRRNPGLRDEVLGDLMRAASFKFGANRRAKR